MVSVLFSVACAFPAFVNAQHLQNPGFENGDDQGNPTGWTILTDLDEATYNKPDFKYRFNAIQPVTAEPGRGGKGHALAFPHTGTWRCEVSEQDRGRIAGEIDSRPGSQRGKAAAYQVVTLKPGKYRFSAHLRTADGDGWSGAFSLGVATNGTAQYAHNNATGIQWTQHNLAMRGDPNGDYPVWGEWQKCSTEYFEVEEETSVSVWIRLLYVNKHATRVRWEIDDAAINPEPVWDARFFLGSDAIDDMGNITFPQDRSFTLDLSVTPWSTWRKLFVTFRHADDHYRLTVSREGDVELRSTHIGLVKRTETGPLNGAFKIRLAAAGQYMRVDLPNHAGFESRLIGPSDIRIAVKTEPVHSARIGVRPGQCTAFLPSLPMPVASDFTKIYDPSVGEEGPWYINDHCFIRDTRNTWHLFGITHAEPFNPPDEDFFAHATANRVTQSPWNKQPHVNHVNEEAGETHVWAPHIVRQDDTYYMFYCGGGEEGDAYQINLRTSKNLTDWSWYDGNPLFTDIGNARDPMVLSLNEGTYLMYYTRPASVDEPFSGVAVRESRDLLHWSEPQMALVTHVKERCGRKTESPFVFEHEGAYYLSATGLSGGYRDTRVWRSLNPRRFNPDHIVARIDAHAPEWIRTEPGPPPAYVSHCGWKQGGVYLAPVRWETVQWDAFGLLVVPLDPDQRPAHIEVRRRPEDRDPYRTISASEQTTSYALPPGRYHVSVRSASGDTIGPLPIEIVADDRTRFTPRPKNTDVR